MFRCDNFAELRRQPTGLHQASHTLRHDRLADSLSAPEPLEAAPLGAFQRSGIVRHDESTIYSR